MATANAGARRERSGSVAAGIRDRGRPSPFCSVDIFRLPREHWETYLIAVATNESVHAPDLPPRFGMPAFDSAGNQRGPYYPTSGSDKTSGQVVTVERAGGYGSDSLDTRPFRAVLVPWGLGNRCEAFHHAGVRWRGKVLWHEPGPRAFFRAYLRPRQHWASGLPTFDVLPADQAPYPTHWGRWRDNDLVTPAPAAWLSVDEYWQLYEVVPSFAQVWADEGTAFRRLDEWAERNPDLARRMPATRILQFARSYRDYLRKR